MAQFKAGDVLGQGKYELVRMVGEGTYGVVWEALDTELQKKVAIKRMHPQKGRVADLQKEALAQARLNHPNIAMIYDVSIDEQFIAMEFVDGCTLDRRLKECVASDGWCSRDQAMDILGQCFEALTYAHEQAVVHGDIKPGNIMLRVDEIVKITDFGVAKVLTERGTTEYPRGRDRRLGTITYMAPEVAQGASRDMRSDVFSLGVLAYTLLSGRHPFYNTHPSGLFSVRDMLMAQEEALPLISHDATLPRQHCDVVMRMVAKKPEDRYVGVKEAYKDWVGITLVCTLCQQENPLAAKFCMSCGRSLAEVISKEFENKSARELQERAYQLNSVSQHAEAIKYCDEALRMEPDLAAAHFTKGYALARLRNYDKAMESYDQALRLESNPRQLANIHKARAYVYFRLHQREEAVNELEEALRLDPDNVKARQELEKLRQTEDVTSA